MLERGEGQRVVTRAYTGFGTQTKKYPNSIKNRYKKLQELCLDVLGQKFNLSARYKKGSTIDLISVRIYDSDRFTYIILEVFRVSQSPYSKSVPE